METKLNYLSKLIILSLMFASAAFSQNITNTLGTGGLFTIKDASTNFLTLSQSTGQVNILNTLRLEDLIGSSVGTIFKGNDRFLHTTAEFSTFLGINSGNFGMTGTGNTGIGYQSLLSNSSGNGNVAVGSNSMRLNTSGRRNVAIGSASLSTNTSGIENTALGLSALGFSNGSFNTAVGNNALLSNTTGDNNIALGYNANVPSGTDDNQVRIGNDQITYAGVQVAWTITSDRRWKSNILNSNLGLSFISKLRPVSYTRNNDEKQKTEYGFIAQEIEDVLKESGVDNCGMITIDDKGSYEMRYNDLLAPMVKAIQELKAENEKLKQDNEKLSSEVESLKSTNDRIVKLEQIVNELTSIKHTSLTGKKVNLTNSK